MDVKKTHKPNKSIKKEFCKNKKNDNLNRHNHNKSKLQVG